ncbi:oxidoreductase [Roseibium album]|uniref:oxidoreductase n=1 Tax=Roseibium album TaxID=311410 RepID=UPI002490984A|nr:oxidoreductase [Roseibium album]
MAKNEATMLLDKPLVLPCGARLKNRLIKSPMSDSLGDGTGNPTKAQTRLYERWAEGGVALSLIGEVQTSPHYPEKPGNLVLVQGSDTAGLRILAKRGSINDAHIWPQLGHAGALAHLPVSKPKGPSPLNVEGLQCQGLSLEEIHELPGLFARAATMAKDTGFGGVQIHAGHGFLLSQFLSPLFNHRADAYGGSIEGRFRVIGEVIDAVRRAVGPSFPVGIRINSTDKLVGGLTDEDALQVVRMLDRTSIDLIDVSGGTYFPGAASSSDGVSASGPYFIEFARHAKKMTEIPIMVTGGMQTRADAFAALQTGAADAIGLARAMVLDPALANSWLSGLGGDPAFPRFETPPRGGITAWYSMRLKALGENEESLFAPTLEEALEAYEARDAERCPRWLEHFGS